VTWASRSRTSAPRFRSATRADISFIENYQEAVKVEKTESDRWKFFLRRTGIWAR